MVYLYRVKHVLYICLLFLAVCVTLCFVKNSAAPQQDNYQAASLTGRKNVVEGFKPTTAMERYISVYRFWRRSSDDTPDPNNCMLTTNNMGVALTMALLFISSETLPNIDVIKGIFIPPKR